MKVECKGCATTYEKPQLEHLIYHIKKSGGHLGNKECPKCKGQLKYL